MDQYQDTFRSMRDRIVVLAQEGLQVDCACLEYAPQRPMPYQMLKRYPTSSFPTFVRANITYAEILDNIPHDIPEDCNGIRISEYDLEVYLTVWLSRNLNTPVKSFRWTWDRYRVYSAA